MRHQQVLSTVLALFCAGSVCADALDQAHEQLKSAQQQLNLVKSLATPKEITRDCVAAPIPTTPVGPSWTFQVQTGPNAQLRGTGWRQPCGGNDGQFILTLQPMQGTPFVCGSEIEINIGALRTDDILLDVNPNDNVATSFCGNLGSTTSFVLNEFDDNFAFDDDVTFNLVYESDFAADAITNIPAFDPALYGGGTGNAVITGKYSGSYYANSRNGEGVVVEVGTVGARRVVFLTWYTYFQGQQRWIVGSVDITSTATEANIPLFITSGGQFGSAFDPSQVSVTAWGNVNVQFPSCTAMRFQWAENGGQSGTYNYSRVLDGLQGISCP